LGAESGGLINIHYQKEYQEKLVSPEEAVRIVKNGDWIDFGFGHSKPVALDRALALRKDELKDINIRHVLSLSPQACIEADPEGEVFALNSWYFPLMTVNYPIEVKLIIHPWLLATWL